MMEKYECNSRNELVNFGIDVKNIYGGLRLVSGFFYFF